MTPLVSVITPTWGRHDLLINRCLPSVLAQTYPNIEHVIVSDGPDDYLADLLPLDGRQTFAQLDVHPPHARWGHWSRLRGIEKASGEILAWLDDDNAFRPHHIARLVAALQESGAGLAYSQALFQGRSSPYVVGSQPPACAQLDTSVLVHRRELLDLATWRDEGQPTVEWDLVERWLREGATWTFVPEVTVDYYFTN